MNRGSRTKIAGFTLIELMIVVAVIALLAAIAYPSFADSVRKGRRGQAKADLLELTQLLERHRTVNNTYAGFALPFAQSPQDGTARYVINLDNQSATTYDLSAVPQGGQAEDTRCMTLGINQAGVKTESGSATAAECW